MDTDTFNAICDCLAESTNSITTVCKMLDVPVWRFMDRIAKDKEAEARYGRAKAAQVQMLADSIREMEATALKEVNNAKDSRTKSVMLQYYKMLIDNLKWMLGKLAPKVYGDFQRSEVEHKNLPAIPTRLEVVIAQQDAEEEEAELSPRKLAKRIKSATR